MKIVFRGKAHSYSFKAEQAKVESNKNLKITEVRSVQISIIAY